MILRQQYVFLTKVHEVVPRRSLAHSLTMVLVGLASPMFRARYDDLRTRLNPTSRWLLCSSISSIVSRAV